MLKRNKAQIKKSKRVLILYILLRVSVVLVMIAQYFRGSYENMFLCGLTLLLFTLPAFVEKKAHVRLPESLEIIVLLFIFAAEILGEIHAFYINIPLWDSMLHTTTGFLAAAVGFCLVDLLNRHTHESKKLSPFYLALMAFCFSMTIGVLWEFFEFAMDFFMGMDMQKDTIVYSINTTFLDPSKSNQIVHIGNIKDLVINGQRIPIDGYLDIGLIDTMKDMFVNFIGAFVFSVIGYIFLRDKKEDGIATRLIPVVEEDEDNNDDDM